MQGTGSSGTWDCYSCARSLEVKKIRHPRHSDLAWFIFTQQGLKSFNLT